MSQGATPLCLCLRAHSLLEFEDASEAAVATAFRDALLSMGFESRIARRM